MENAWILRGSTVFSNSSPTEMKKFRILIVEDINLFRQAFKATLQASSPMIAIDEVADGDEVLQKVDTFLPDLIFMDIRLPGENGLELTKKIKATHPNITILILTAYDTPEYQKVALKYGADGFFAKTSLNPTELKELVNYYQESRNQPDPCERI